MPIYEYKCAACGYQFEHIQRASDSDLEDCPRCKAKSVKRLLSAAAFHLKGSGWYKTDYAASGSSAAPSTSVSTAPVESTTTAQAAASSSGSGDSGSSSSGGSDGSSSTGGAGCSGSCACH